MTEPKQYKRGKHSYTRWGTNFKEVRVEGTKKEVPAPSTETSVTMNVEPAVETGVYSNFFMVHRSADEVLLDFCFVPPGQSMGRIRSRVVLPFGQVHQLADILKKTSDEIRQQP